nr:MAG TPA: hypothetical protein [Caudoviricetes sp.]
MLSPTTCNCAHYSVATLFLQINICGIVKINNKTAKVRLFSYLFWINYRQHRHKWFCCCCRC